MVEATVLNAIIPGGGVGLSFPFFLLFGLMIILIVLEIVRVSVREICMISLI